MSRAGSSVFPEKLWIHCLLAHSFIHAGFVWLITGRVIFLRNTGKLCFVRLREGSGAEIQAMLSLADVGEDSLAEFKALVDIGDLLAVTGEVITSRRGELSV